MHTPHQSIQSNLPDIVDNHTTTTITAVEHEERIKKDGIEQQQQQEREDAIKVPEQDDIITTGTTSILTVASTNTTTATTITTNNNTTTTTTTTTTSIFHEIELKIQFELSKERQNKNHQIIVVPTQVSNELMTDMYSDGTLLPQHILPSDTTTPTITGPTKSKLHHGHFYSNHNISIKDPNFDSTMVQIIVPTLLDILERWEQLIQLLHYENVFGQYLINLERAFRAVHTTTMLYGTAICTLLELLIQSAQHHSYDQQCIECRFVTLLEIILSYDNPRWEPSDAIKMIWIRLLQRIPTNITPTNFRRKAYRVLVSLSWVPSSKGLLSACSFDETKQLPKFHPKFRPNANKDRISTHMSKIMNHGQQFTPLPRHDSVNQILDRLKDETDVCVAITSQQEGMGKTTLAGQVASHPSIVRVFTVLWLDMKQKVLTFDSYILYLKDLCQQLEITEPEWPVSLQRFEEPAIRKLRELRSMKIAKTIMSTVTEQLGNNLLLVLDDVPDADTLQWFRFTEQQSMIVTTPKHTNFDGVDWTLDLLSISHEEATELFLKEAGLSPEHILGRTTELRTIVQHCDCHPLTIRTIARWFLLKQVTAGIICAIDEILCDLKSLSEARTAQMWETNFVEDPNELIFDILSLMMGPLRKNEADTQSVLFVLCFAAMVVVFPDVAPLDSVILLWEQILKKEILATDEIGGALTWKEIARYVWLIAEGLTHMGVISIVDVDGWYVVQVHHHIYEEFGMLIAKEMEVKETFHHTTVDWHKYFVTGYMAKKSQGMKENHDRTWKYMVEKLPSHLFLAKMVSTTKIVLNQEEFFRARIEALGWSRGIEMQINDCVRLQNGIENDLDNGDESEAHVSRLFHRTSILIQEAKVGMLDITEEDRCELVAKALYLLGFALTENGYFRDALAYLKIAGSIPHESQTLQTKIAYATCWCFLAENQTTKAKRKAESIQLSVSRDKVWLNNEIFQLKAAVLLGACYYRAAKILLEDFLTELQNDEANNCIELAMTYDKLGRLYFLMGEYNLSKDALTNCIDRKHDIGEVSRSLSSTLGVLGDINVELGLFNDAKGNYIAAIQALKTLRCNEQHLDYRFITGKLQFINNDFVNCCASLELVRRTSNATPLKVYDQSAYDLRCIARVYFELGDIEESITVLCESLNMTKSRSLSLERAKCMIDLGRCYLKTNVDRKALSFFQQAREIQMGKLGIYGDMIDTTNLIGGVHLKLSANTEAVAVFKKNYDDAMKAIPGDTSRLMETMYLLADAYEAAGNCYDAIDCFTTCLTVLCRPETARVKQRLGHLSMSCKEYDKAFEFLTTALAICREIFDHTGIVDALTSLGILLRIQVKYNQAENYLLEAFELAKKEDDPKNLNSITLELGFVYRLLTKLDEAHELYRECIDNMDEDNSMYGQVLMTLGHVKFAQGDYVNASCDYERALLKFSETHGGDDYQILQANRSFGLADFFSGKFDCAFERFEIYIQCMGRKKSSAAVDAVLVHVFAGDISYARHDYETAKSAWNHAMTAVSKCNRIGHKTPEWVFLMVENRLQRKNEEIRDRSNYEMEIRELILVEDLHSTNATISA